MRGREKRGKKKTRRGVREEGGSAAALAAIAPVDSSATPLFASSLGPALLLPKSRISEAAAELIALVSDGGMIPLVGIQVGSVNSENTIKHI